MTTCPTAFLGLVAILFHQVLQNVLKNVDERKKWTLQVIFMMIKTGLDMTTNTSYPWNWLSAGGRSHQVTDFAQHTNPGGTYPDGFKVAEVCLKVLYQIPSLHAVLLPLATQIKNLVMNQLAEMTRVRQENDGSTSSTSSSSSSSSSSTSSSSSSSSSSTSSNAGFGGSISTCAAVLLERMRWYLSGG